MSDPGPTSGATPPPLDPTTPGGAPPVPPQPPAPPAYGAPQYGYGYPVPVATGTNGLAIASLVCAFLCSPLGLIFGFIARNQIKTSRQDGDGLAMAGIIISIVFMALGVAYVIAVFAFFHTVTHGLNNINFNNLNNFINNFGPTQTP